MPQDCTFSSSGTPRRRNTRRRGSRPAFDAALGKADQAAPITNEELLALLEREGASRRDPSPLPRRPMSAECKPLGIYWVVVDDPNLGRALRPARDPEGRDLLPTPVEHERQIAERRIRELEEQLSRR